MKKYILGVDSGGTAFKLRAMSLEGQVLAEYEGIPCRHYQLGEEETIRRMFLVQLRPAQEVRREKVAKETGTSAPDKSQVKRAPVRKEHKVGPNDPCPLSLIHI